MEYPYKRVEIAWKRPPIDREIIRKCTVRSDLQGFVHCLGVLAILGASGGLAYYLFAARQWLWMALALYVHGALFAFNPQTHELSHGTVFKTRWLNEAFKRLFGLIHWTSNSPLYKMSHTRHHLYTLHRQSDGEVVQPAPEMSEQVIRKAIEVVDPLGLVMAVYDQIMFLFTPFLRNPRRDTWLRYVYSEAGPQEQRDVTGTHVSQFLFHAGFAVLAIVTGTWFLIVVVSLPAFYGGRWYHMWVHDTMHVGRQPEVDDFRPCCRSVRVDPFTSFLFWHMEWHTEHHAYAAIPSYNLGKFHRLTRKHWDPPQTLPQAWREMDDFSRKLLSLQT